MTDNGTQLTSNVMKDFLKTRGIGHIPTSLHNPQGNRMVEQAKRMIKGTIQMAVSVRKGVCEAEERMVWV